MHTDQEIEEIIAEANQLRAEKRKLEIEEAAAVRNGDFQAADHLASMQWHTEQEIRFLLLGLEQGE